MEILKVENLTKKYGKKENEVIAIKDMSFSVEKGDFVAIVGSSGSGKSTLLHLIGGVDRPTYGKVYIDGKDIYSLTEDELAIFRRRQVGIIYQFYNLIPILNVEENIKLPCDLDGKVIDKIPDNTPAYKIYNIGCGHPTQLMDFIHTLEDCLGKKAKMEMLPMQPGDVYQTYADTRKLKEEVEYNPNILLSEGIQSFVDWYKVRAIL